MIRCLILLSAFVVLAACAQPPAPKPVATLPPPPAPLPPPAVPIPQQPPAGEPTAFLNLPPANLRSLLGAPQFVRQDGASEMWRYDGASCRAFFFLQGPAG